MLPTIALCIWPIVALVLCVALGPQRGLIWSTVVGYLFLPDGFAVDLPGLPTYAKFEAVAVGALLGVAATRNRLPPLPPGEPDRLMKFAVLLCLACMVVGPVLTMMVNTYPVFFGPTMRQGIRYWDAQGQVIATMFMFVPFFLGRRILARPEMHNEILKAIVLVGLAYTLLVLFERRMSPQLNNMVYGYFPHAWIQHLRGGGFRPIVFLDHGLSVGFFLLTAVLAAIALIWEYGKEKRAFYLVSAIWLMLVLLVSRNLGAVALALLFVPAAILFSRRMQLRIAALVALIFFVNPVVRDVYVEPLLNLTEKISIDRWGSLKTRFDNETRMMERVNEKPLTGWGGWGRWRVYDEQGRDITISDGTWIITLGKWGWLGFIGLFGMISAPLWLALRASKRAPPGASTAALALMTAANLIYLIPNSTLTPIAWLAIGALAGFAQFAPAAKAAETEDGPAEEAVADRRPRYSRFGPGAVGDARLTRYR